ncbi:SAM-dependent methyltransferase [Nakamurella sp. UYEF19]|uniref:class I SAM-dependent DNA methyltransferase n=1 Tax=Nakamurella sp. UYEF19 TaxID=1756392 RepID=UPI003391F3C2
MSDKPLATVEPTSADPPTSSPEATSSPEPTSPATLWEQQVVGERWEFYAARFDDMFADGTDVEGEARFVDALLPRRAAVLDAGCGTGRIANALHRMGHRSVGVDKDAGLIDIARQRYPGVPYLACDLSLLSPELLETVGAPTQFDVIVLPGNVMVYLAPGSERQVLANLAGLLAPAGRIVAGFAIDRDYSTADFRTDAEALGLTVEHHFATWQLGPVTPDADWAVIVLRGPGAEDVEEDGSTKWAPANSWPAPVDGSAEVE